MITALTLKPLKRLTHINREVLPESTPEDFEIEYVDISNVSGMGRILGTETLPFGKAPSRARRLVGNGDTIISTVRTYLRAIASIQSPPPNLVVSTGFATLTPGPEIDGGFFAYLAQTEHFIHEVVSRSTGVSYPAITPSELGNIKISYPPLPTQHRIAAYLDRETAQIDALVAEKETLLGLLEEKRASLISHAVTRGLNPKAKLKPSGIPWLGDVPVHWEVRRMRFLLKGSMRYGANESALLEDPDHPRFIRITDLNPDGSLRPETFKSLPFELAEPYLLEEGDRLFARTGATVGKALIYRESMGPACYAGYLIRARLKTAIMLPDFLFQFTQSAVYWEQIRLGTIQATIQNFSAEKYAEMLVPLPPTINEQREVVDFVVSATASIQSAIAEIQTSITLLREKRSSLISAAVTGEMAVD